ncbi:hypothetical protein T03_8714 [Trichinella britovi]|uniref:Uncharacterized protein n=1 Tax=Trichinella britovi TaxID=45882 RepID=A0A0V1C6K7_TRIBR|nr:hypothetical protein T03_8714 [Trichinella britovi]
MLLRIQADRLNCQGLILPRFFPQEPADISVRFRKSYLQVHFLDVFLQTNPVPPEANQDSQQIRLKLHSRTQQVVQHPFQALQMLLLSLPEDDNVIKIDEACIPRQSPQRFLHQTLKRRRGVAKTVRHDAELEESQGCGKRRLLPVSFRNFDLPEAGRQVERAEPLGPSQRFAYARDGLGVNARHGIQLAVVHAKPQGTVLLPNWHYQ